MSTGLHCTAAGTLTLTDGQGSGRGLAVAVEVEAGDIVFSLPWSQANQFATY